MAEKLVDVVMLLLRQHETMSTHPKKAKMMATVKRIVYVKSGLTTWLQHYTERKKGMALALEC